MKRDTSGNTVNKTCAAAARIRMNLTVCTGRITTNWTKPYWVDDNSYNESTVADDLPAKLKTYSFNGAVTEAVRKCFNDSASDAQKCELAGAAVILYGAIKEFIEVYGSGSQMPYCSTITNTSTYEKLYEEVLCDASVYILDLLEGANDGEYHKSGSCRSQVG